MANKRMVCNEIVSYDRIISYDKEEVINFVAVATIF